MLEIINLSYEDGLDPRNYHSSQLNKLTIQIDATDDPERLTKLLVSFDLLLSDAYFQYAYHLHYGYLTSEKLFPYWKAGTNKVDLIKLLNTALDKDNLNETIADLAPHYPGYATLKTKMNIYQKAAIINGNWKSIPRNAIPLEKGDSGKAIALLQESSDAISTK